MVVQATCKCDEDKINAKFRSKLRTVDENSGKRAVEGVGALVRVERLQVLDVRELLEIASDTDLVAVLGRRCETNCVVQLLQAGDGDGLVAAGVNMSAGRRRDADGRGRSRSRCHLLLNIVDVEGGLEAAHAREHGRGLNKLDVGVEMFGDAVFGRADHRLPGRVVSPDVVLLGGGNRSERVDMEEKRVAYRFEHGFGKGHWDFNEHPVLRGRTRETVLVEAVRGKPLVHEVNALRFRRNQRLDLLLGEVLAIAVVERIARRVFSNTTRRNNASITYLTS